MSSPIMITHIPHGIEHPYEASPVERQPRIPIAGEPITLGVQTTPAGAIAALSTLVRINDRQEERIAAHIVSDEAMGTNWCAHLPALQAGDQVSYRFQVEPGAVATAAFTFTVAGWQTAGAVRDWRQELGW